MPKTTKPKTAENSAESCYGQPRFVIDSEEANFGVCTKTGIYVLVEFVKREKLCDCKTKE